MPDPQPDPHPDPDPQAPWTDLGSAADFPVESHTCVDHAGHPLIVFHVDGAFHVMQNVCPHAGLPLGDGDRRGMTITCPYHAYTYHIANGTDLDDPQHGQPATVYPTRTHDGTVQTQLPTP